MQGTGVNHSTDTAVPAEDTMGNGKVACKGSPRPAEYPLPQETAPQGKKDLKMDFQVVNVPLITSESVPAAGRKCCSKNLLVIH